MKDDIFGKKDTYEVAARCLKLCKEMKGNWIIVDGEGLGAGVVDSLRHIIPDDGSITVYEFRGSEAASDNRRFANKRAEAHFVAADCFANGWVSLNDDPILKKQLNYLTYSWSNGRMIVVDKDDIRKRLGTSPDRADALIMALWYLDKAPSMIVDRLQGNKEREEARWVQDRQREIDGVGRTYYDLEQG